MDLLGFSMGLLIFMYKCELKDDNSVYATLQLEKIEIVIENEQFTFVGSAKIVGCKRKYKVKFRSVLYLPNSYHSWLNSLVS